MKRLLIGSAIAVGLLMSGYAMAQTATVTIAPEKRAIIKQYVVKQKIKPITIKERVRVGMAVPAEVELAPVPEAIYTEVPTVRNYRYFYWDDRVVFVDPANRHVIEIVE